MPKDAPPNGGAMLERPGLGSLQQVSGMQTKLHCWAAAVPGRRFDDLFNFVWWPGNAVDGVRPGRGRPGCDDGGRGRLDRGDRRRSSRGPRVPG